MVEGLEFDVYNFTNGDLDILEMENEGLESFHWYIEPWTLTLPHTMAFTDTLTFNVKIDLPVQQLPGEFVMDTMDILTAKGLKQVFIKVDSDLLSGTEEPGNILLADIGSIYPNPANGQVTLSVTVESATHVVVEVYSIDGRRVAVLADEEMLSGDHEIRWNTNENGQQLPAGIYMVRLQTERGAISRKLAISR